MIMTADAPANPAPSADVPHSPTDTPDNVLVVQVPDWYGRLTAAADDDASPMQLREDITLALRYIAELHLTSANATGDARDARLAAGRAIVARLDAEDALRTALLAADDNLTPHVAADEVAKLREACRAGRAVVNLADDAGVAGSGDDATIRLAHALAAVNA